MRKSQVAFEFIIMIGLGMIFLAIFASALNTILAERNEAALDERFNDLGHYIRQELAVARIVRDGYTRNFTIPPAEFNHTFERHPYTLNASDGYLTITQGENIYTFEIPLVEGDLHIGENTLVKTGGTVYVNP